MPVKEAQDVLLEAIKYATGEKCTWYWHEEKKYCSGCKFRVDHGHSTSICPVLIFKKIKEEIEFQKLVEQVVKTGLKV